MPVEQTSQDLGTIATAADFVRELQALREQSGLTIREVAKAAKTSVSTTGDYFSGRHLPLDRDQFGRILAACGETDAERAEAWQAALSRVRRSPGRRAEPPYRGLARYEAADERWFFGREDVTELISFLAEQRSDLPLMLVGASGAGKSSLLHAGLLPRLRAAVLNSAGRDAAAGGEAQVTIYDLTATGIAELTARVIEAAPTADPSADWDQSAAWGETASAWSGAGETPSALIVDQFEAVFTLPAQETQRGALIAALCDLARHTLVVLALRADFYGQAIRHPGLLRALQERHVLLGPMSTEQVRRAVVEPARLARTDVEEGLVEVVLSDLAPQGADQRASGQAHEPGALPLLSHAMRCAWEHSRGGTVSVADYLASGGIKNALTQSAERAYDSLTPEQQTLARQQLLQLVHVSEDLPPSRAAVPLSELRGPSGRPRKDSTHKDTVTGTTGDANRVLDVFVSERLITVDADSAQFTHDALLTAWPRLRTWIAENSEGLLARRRISDAARTWADTGREEAALWRGSQLAIAREWAASPGRRAALPGPAREFVDASVAAGTSAERLERRRTRRLRAIVAVLTVLVLAVAGLTGYAFSLRSQAVSAEHSAEVDGQAANSRAIAFVSDQTRDTDPAVAAQLSAAAYAVSPTAQATAALLESSAAPTVTRVEDSPGVVQWVSVSPNRRLVAVAAADGSLRLWNVTAVKHPVLVATLAQPNATHPLYTAAFSPNGTVIAAAGAGQVVHLWTVGGPAADPTVALINKPLTGPTNTIYSIAFSPNGQTLAAGSADGTVRLWHVANPAAPAPVGGPLTLPGTQGAVQPAVQSVAFGDDGQVLAAGTSAGTVGLWEMHGSAAPVRFAHMPLTGPGAEVTGVAFNPRGDTLAASSQDHKVWLWAVAAGTVRGSKHPTTSGKAEPEGTLTGAGNWVNTVAFSPDGTALGAGTSDASVLVWNLSTRTLTTTVAQPQPVTSVAWDGPRRVVASDANGTVVSVGLPSPVLAAGNSPDGVVYSPDGKTIAVGGTSVQLWDNATRTLRATRPLPAKVTVEAIAYANAAIAVALSDGTVELLNPRTVGLLAGPFPVISGSGLAESVAFSPDGKLLLTGADDGSVRLYNVTDPARPRPLATAHDSGDQVYTVAFAPDGATVAAASTDDAVRLYRVGGPSGLTPTGPKLGDMTSYAIGLSFSPDSKTLAVGSADKTVHLWSVADPAHPVLFGPALTGPSGYVWAAAFNPAGTELAIGSTDGTVWLWNVAAPAHPALIATLTSPAGHVYSVAFSPSGTQLAATSYDGTVHLWDTSPAAALASVCNSMGQTLPEKEWAGYVQGVPYRAPCS